MGTSRNLPSERSGLDLGRARSVSIFRRHLWPAKFCRRGLFLPSPHQFDFFALLGLTQCGDSGPVGHNSVNG